MHGVSLYFLQKMREKDSAAKAGKKRRVNDDDDDHMNIKKHGKQKRNK